jgi:nucleoside-diphosphate-sugar epimerase
MTFHPGTVLLTGGAGFVGSSIARRLVELGVDVHLLFRPGSDLWRVRDFQSQIHFHESDLLDEPRTLKVFRSVNPEAVLHLAAYGGHPEEKDADRILRTNFLGFWNVLRACVPTRCELIVNAGSSSEYGFKGHASRETDLLEPNSFYAVSKAAATHLGRYASRLERFSIATLRLGSVFGPYEAPTRLIPTVIQRSLLGQPLDMVDPETGRDFVFIDDVVRAFTSWDRLRALKGDSVNIGSGIQSTVRDALETILDLTGSQSVVRWNRMPPRIWDTKTWVSDISQARLKLDWIPRVSFREGIKQTIEWHCARMVKA